MSRTIYKYKLLFLEGQIILLPKNFKILSVQIQKDELQLWALIDPSETELIEKQFFIYFTGESIPNDDKLIFLSTIQMKEGEFVGHIFFKD